MVAYLKREEPELWKWFSSNKVRQEHGDAVRLDLLKSSYRIEEAGQPQLYAQAKEVMARLALDVPLTFYQGGGDVELNAALAYLPGEAHIILMGKILDALSEAEMRAMVGHELAHFSLFEGSNGEFVAASEILEALNNDGQAQSCHRESARLFRLYSEIVADRGAFLAARNSLVVISKLLKLETRLAKVNPENYLRQAEEILGKGPVKADQQTHPETFIRAKAIHLFAEKDANVLAEVQTLIEGSPGLNELDLLGQREVADTTRKLVHHFLAPRWIQTEPVLAHARTFFSDFEPGSSSALESSVVERIRLSSHSLQTYYSYVLLDFVAVDRQLEEAPLALALLLGEQLGLSKSFGQRAMQELGMSKKRFAAIERDAANIVQNANQVADAT
jgi:hypothetical protein